MEPFIITKPKDISEAIQLLQKDENAIIEFADTLPFSFEFTGTRFNNESEYVSAEVAEVLTIYRREYLNFLSELIGKKVSYEKADVYFKVRRESFDFDTLNDIPKEIREVIKKMDSKHILFSILFATGAYFGSSAWKDTLDNDLAKLKIQKEQTSHDKTLDVAISAIEALKENTRLERSKNKPVQVAIKKLKDDETLSIGSSKHTQEFSSEQVEEFNYEDKDAAVESTLVDTFVIKGFEKLKTGWKVKIKGEKLNTFQSISHLTPKENAKLFQAAEDEMKLTLEVTISKQNKKITEAHILSIK